MSGSGVLVLRMLERQWLHALALALLLAGVAVAARLDAVRAGELLGLASPGWLWLAVAVAVAHQVYVWFCWRAELHGSLLKRALGSKAFSTFAAGFVIIGGMRVPVVWALAVANAGTLPLDPWLARPLAVIALAPSLYLFYSVRRYFGFRRALGIDHFDPSHRNLPLVREGIFRWTPNAMYTFGFLLFWALALWYASVAALVVAAFYHLYIWVHFHATEEPDMRRIYRGKAPR